VGIAGVLDARGDVDVEIHRPARAAWGILSSITRKQPSGWSHQELCLCGPAFFSHPSFVFFGLRGQMRLGEYYLR
jgi:hypothetical protein